MPHRQGLGQRGKALLGVPKKCLVFNTQTCATPPQPLMGVGYSGQADREWNATEVATSYRWREGTAARGQAQFPDALILLGSNSACAYRGSHCTATISPCAAEQGSVGCLAGLFLLHWRAGAAPAPHLDWNGMSGRLWHCHPEPLCKCHNYSKAPLWSLQNSQLKKSILKAAAFK